MTVAGLAEIALLRSPFRGLSPFGDSELDALLFFGRERESELIAANVMAARLTLLYGPTGVGKTSVLRAGMAQRLRALARDNLRDRGAPELAVAIVDSWSGDAVEAVTRSATEAVSDALGGEEVDLGEGTLVDRLGRAADRVGGDLYLVLDQFEEFFLYHGEEAGADTLTEAFPELVIRGDAGVNVLVCLREDALAHLDVFKAKVPGLFANSLRLDRLDRRAARDAILGPLDAFNRLVAPDERVTIEPELVDAVLDQVTVGRIDHGRTGRGTARRRVDRRRIEAPYLQLVLLRVWDAERDAGSRELRRATLEQLGGAQRIVEHHLEGALASLSDAGREGAAAAFRHLVTPSGTKIAHRATDLAGYAGLAERDMQALLATLAAHRIVRPLGGDTPNDDRYEIYHDVLTDAVLAWRTRFEAGRQLAQERAELSRRMRRLAAVTAVSLAALMAMVAVTFYALHQRSEAREGRAEARTLAKVAQTQARRARGRELVARAASALTTDPQRSLDLAAQAARLGANQEVENALRASLLADRQRAVIAGSAPVAAAALGPDGSLVAAGDRDGRVRIARPSGAIVRTLTVGAPVSAVAYGRDGNLAVAAGLEVSVWRPNGSRARLLRHAAPVYALATAPDGTLATGAGDGSVRAFGTADEPLAVTASLGSPIRGIAFSPDGARFLAVGASGAAAVFGLPSGALSFRIDGAGAVRAAAWSPGGRLLATGGPDGVGRVWDVLEREVVGELRGHVGRIVDVVFSPRGSLLATASTDGTAKVWNVSRKGLVAQLVGHANYVLSVQFSPDGRLVATASKDGTARIWRTDSGNPLARLVGHRDSVSSAVFISNGRRVLTWSADGTTRLWDPETQPEAPAIGRVPANAERAAIAASTGVVAMVAADSTARIWTRGRPMSTVRQPGGVAAVALSRDGRVVATGGSAGIALVRQLAPRRGRPVTLRHGSPISAIALDARAAMALTAGADGTAIVWRLADRSSRSLERLERRIASAALSPNGRFAALGDAEGDAAIIDTRTGRVLHPLAGHDDVVTSLAFSPDGRLLVTASRDHDARVWNVETGVHKHLLRAHFALVNGAQFSADLRWIVTAGPGTAGIWDATSGQFQGFVRGHDGALLDAGFTADGSRIRTVGVDGTIRQFRCELCGDVRELRALAEARLSLLARQER